MVTEWLLLNFKMSLSTTYQKRWQTYSNIFGAMFLRIDKPVKLNRLKQFRKGLTTRTTAATEDDKTCMAFSDNC